MHTITNCSRCGNDFMYHNSDYHLDRDVTVIDEVGNNEVITTVICQDCDLSERWIGKDRTLIYLDQVHYYQDGVWVSGGW